MSVRKPVHTPRSACSVPGRIQELYLRTVIHSFCQPRDGYCNYHTHFMGVETEAPRAGELAQSLRLCSQPHPKLLLCCKRVNSLPCGARRPSPQSTSARFRLDVLFLFHGLVLRVCSLGRLTRAIQGVSIRFFSLHLCPRTLPKNSAYNLQSQRCLNFPNVASLPHLPLHSHQDNVWGGTWLAQSECDS